MSLKIDEQLALAAAHLRAGRHQDAIKLYERILHRQPHHLQSLYQFGILAYQLGHDKRAIELLEHAKSVDGRQPQVLNCLSLAQKRQGKLTEALANLTEAVEMASHSAALHNNLGSVQEQLGQLSAATNSYLKAIELDTDYATAHYNLGGLQLAANDLTAASDSLRKSVASRPGYSDAWLRLSQVLNAAGKPQEAERILRKEFVERPAAPDVQCELADSLHLLGRLDEAEAIYCELATNPDYATRVHYALGCLSLENGDYSSAIERFNRCIESGYFSQAGKLHQNAGRASLEMGQVDDAVRHYRTAIARLDPSAQSIALASLAACIAFCPSVDQKEILTLRREWDRKESAQIPTRERAAKRQQKRLRVGYVSSFFHCRNWMKPVWGLLRQHDRDEFEIHVFADCDKQSIQEGYQSDSRDHFHDISGISNGTVAAMIEQNGIDILVDLNGFSRMERQSIFRHRPARLIVGWFNMFSTTGMACFDYLIGDHVVVSEAEEHYYSEKIMRVQSSYLAFEVSYATPAVTALPSLSTGRITFGALASQYKINSTVIETWCRILSACPDAQLLLRNSALKSDLNCSYVRDRFAENGISSDRLLLGGPAEHFEYLKAYSEVDIALDTFPYNGGTTTSEALWQGVPVVTLDGDRWVARTSASILHAAGLSQFVARDLDEYVKLAVEFAQEDARQRLAELRSGMRAQLTNSTACDLKALAADMESAYRQMLLPSD